METTFIDEPVLELRREGEQRILRVRCIPYGQVTAKALPGRREMFRAHAFASAPANAQRVRLRDMSHGGKLPVGVGLRLDDLDDGLYGEFRVYNTPEGRAALENVQEGVYAGVSVGFWAEDDAVEGGVREVRRAQLHHVSLAEEPAYEDARILAVRSADEYAGRYAHLMQAPDLTGLDDRDADATPMTMKLAQALGNVRPRA